MLQTVELPHARIRIEHRPSYLYMVEQGTLVTLEELREYTDAMQSLVERSGLRRALIDGRASTPIEAKPVREAFWRWLTTGRTFEQVAFVLDDEMQVARVNMTALSHRAAIKAFVLMGEAHRWLTGRGRTGASQAFAAVTPTPPGLAAERRTQTPPRPASPVPPSAAIGAGSTPPLEALPGVATSVPRAPRVPGRLDDGEG